MKFQIILFDGFDELDAIAPFEVLHIASNLGAALEVELVSLAGARTISAAHGLSLQSTAKLELSQPPEVLIIPGGGWASQAAQGVKAELQQGEIPWAIAACHQQGTLLASVCTGALLVAAAGLLEGRAAVSHQSAIAELKSRGAEIINARVVDEGDVITAAGVTSGLELGLWLVERFFGSQLALQVEKHLEYERRGVVWQRSDR